MIEEADEIVRGSSRALPGTYASIAHYALTFKYVCGSVYAWKSPSESFKSIVVYMADGAALAESVGDGCFRENRNQVSTEEVRYFAS